MKTKKKVVILGGGFAGIYTYLNLLKHDIKCDCVEVTLVNKNDYFGFIVLAHEVATGGLLPSGMTQSINSLPRDKDTRFIQGEVKKVDIKQKVVLVERENYSVSEKQIMEVPFDYIVMALGSDTQTYGVEGVNEYALTLKDIQDAKKIKNRILESFESALYVIDEDKKRELLTFVIVGGGPTGVELSAEMADYIFDEISDAYPSLAPFAEVILIQSGKRLLPQSNEWFHQKTVNILKTLKVQVLLEKRVVEIKKDRVVLNDGEMKTANVFWSAGVKARDIDIVSDTPFLKDEKSGRIKVNDFLQVPTETTVFVAGDQSWLIDKNTHQPYPMRAQFAVRQGVIVAKNIIAHIHGCKKQEFFWKDSGFIISLGRGGALAEVYGLRLSGFIAWLLYRTAYLLKMVGIRSKLRTGFEWGINLFLPRDITKFD